MNEQCAHGFSLDAFGHGNSCEQDVSNVLSHLIGGSAHEMRDPYRNSRRPEFLTLDSGERVDFPSGMRRDSNKGKPRFDLLMPEGVPYADQMLTRLAGLMARGADLRGDRNWEKADSEVDLSRFRESAFRHFMQWMAGETDEDHFAATIFNMHGAEHVARKLNGGPVKDSPHS